LKIAICGLFLKTIFHNLTLYWVIHQEWVSETPCLRCGAACQMDRRGNLVFRRVDFTLFFMSDFGERRWFNIL